MKLYEIDSSENDREFIRQILDILPKKSAYDDHKIVGSQHQYWFDLTIPLTDWAWQKKVNSDDREVVKAFFQPRMDRINQVLASSGAKAVARGMNIVVVRG